MNRKKFLKGSLIVLAIIAILFIGARTEITQNSYTIGTNAYAAGTADYYCDGVADNAQWQVAIDALPPGGGKLVGLTGDYVFSANVNRAIDNITIQGTGKGTYFARDNSNPIFSVGSQSNWTFRDCSFDGGGILYSSGSVVTLQNVWIGSTYYALLVSNDITGASIRAPTGRSATIVVAASDATATEKAQADYQCDGMADDVQIEAAIAVISATGNRGTVQLLGHDFDTTSQIEAVSKVDVIGNNAEIELTHTGAQYTLYVSGVTNSKWKGITFRRTGTGAGTTSNGNIYITGTGVDKAFVLEDCNGYSDFIDSSNVVIPGLCINNGACPITIRGEYKGSTGNQGSGIYVGTATNIETVTTAPEFYGVYGESRATGLTGNHGFDLDNSAAKCYYCVGKASDAQPDGGYGFRRAYRSNAYTFNCIGIGGDAADASDSGGFLFEGTAIGYSISDVAKSGGIIGTGSGVDYSYGMRFLDNACSTVVNPTILHGNSVDFSRGVSIEDNSSPNIQGGISKPMDYATEWGYDDANNGRFRPFAGIAYQIVGIEIQVINAAAGGAVLDIGTSAGGNQVYNNQAIDVAGTFQPVLTKALVAANGYLYATPSVAIPDADLVIRYVVLPISGSSQSQALYLNTTGKARISGTQFILAGAGAAGYIDVTNLNWRMDDVLFENTTPTNCALQVSADVANLPIYNGKFVGILVGNIMFALPSSITQGQTVTASGSLTAGNANAIAFAFHNFYAQDGLIAKVTIEVTTAGGTPGSLLQVGIADDATGTNLGSEFFTAIPLNTPAIYDSYLVGDTGAQTKWIFIQDSASATDGWIVGKITVQNAASLVGKYYITVVGR